MSDKSLDEAMAIAENADKAIQDPSQIQQAIKPPPTSGVTNIRMKAANNQEINSAVASGFITDQTLITAGMDHLNRGIQNIHAAQRSAVELRKSYEQVAKRASTGKVACLLAESMLMTYFGYGAVEHYTGFKGTTEAVAANAGISGAISVTRAYTQYRLMKRGEEAFAQGNRLSGSFFTAAGISLAALNCVFVAMGFAVKYGMEEQELAMTELKALTTEEASVHEAKAAEQTRLNSEISNLDAKIQEIKSGAKDPAIDALQTEIERLQGEINTIRDHDNNNDGKYTSWDKQAQIDINNYQQQISELSQERTELLSKIGTALPAEQQNLLDATIKQRLSLDKQIDELDARFAPQLDALKASRSVWETKLANVTGAGGDALQTLLNNRDAAIEGTANIAALSVANWVAALQGHKQDVVRDILAGTADEPWQDDKTRAKLATKMEQAFKKSNVQNQRFLGYTFTPSRTDHLMDESYIGELAEALKNPERLRAELKMEIARQHGQMIETLNSRFKGLDKTQYQLRLDTINNAYKEALTAADCDDILDTIDQLVSGEQSSATVTARAQQDDTLPVIESPKDPAYRKLRKGESFMNGDGQLMRKL